MTGWRPSPRASTHSDRAHAGRASARSDHAPRRREIVLAALGLAQDQGFETINLRALASRLGCSPMALYRYVANKEDLLCAMADEALSEAAMPSTDMAWDEWYVEVTLRYWSVMGRYSGLAAYVLTRGPVLQAPNSLAATERMFTVLLDAGFEPGEAALLWQTAHAFLSGMVLLSQGRSRRSDSARPHLGGETSPGVRAVFESLYAVPDEQALEAGLRRLLSGFTPRPRRG